MLHKNSQKRIIQPGLVYFITTVTKNRYPYFEDQTLCQLFIEELKLCKKLKAFNLYAFCILYDHTHLMIEPNDEYDISKIIKSLKENFSRDTNKIISSNENFPVGDTSTCRLQIRKFIEKYKIKHSNLNIPQFKWQQPVLSLPARLACRQTGPAGGSKGHISTIIFVTITISIITWIT